jgi:hypothetical protein
MEVKDQMIIDILRNRDGQKTIVRLDNGVEHTVWNIAWGYDFEEGFAHITTNISPNIEGVSIDFFYTSDVLSIIDSSSENALFAKSK